MPEVVASERGYFGGMIREIGDRFEVPSELWDDAKNRPKWCQPAAFGGKGDHDGDGKPGGAKPAPAKKGGKKAQADEPAEPFADAPAPIEAAGNGIKEALGVEPDWVAPQPIED